MSELSAEYPLAEEGEPRRAPDGRTLRDPMVDYLALAGGGVDLQAEARQVIARLEAAPEWPLSNPPAPRRPGVYALYLVGRRRPVYVGHTHGIHGLQGRLKEHAQTIQLHEGLALEQVRCRFVPYGRRDPIAALERALVRYYRPPWNLLVGFGSGPSRKGLPPVGHWEERYPRRGDGG